MNNVLIKISRSIFFAGLAINVAACSSNAPAPVTVATETASPNTNRALSEGNETEQTIKSILDQLNIQPVPSNPAPILSPITPSDSSAVVWTLDTNSAPLTPKSNVIIPENIATENGDSSLAADALAAAFALIRQSTGISDALIKPTDAPTALIHKSTGGIRAAMLLPLNGTAKDIGTDMRRGAELAIFTLGNTDIDLTFHDTAGDIDQAMGDAISQGADIIIGPLFANNAMQIKPAAALANIPVLSFSNDSTAHGGGVWLIGQTPEQEIETVLNHALENLSPIDGAGRRQLAIAIITQDNAYGARVSQHAIKIIRGQAGIYAEQLTLEQPVLDDEKSLRQSIKGLTKWLPSSSGGASVGARRLPNFDIVLIAGDAGFSLRVAPVLSWYDLDSKIVQYLGTSVWDSAAILQEPSLIGGWFAQLPSDRSDGFSSIWQSVHQTRASKYAILAFDAVAMASTLDRASPDLLKQSLINDAGFSGFSGVFHLKPDGATLRSLEIRSITNNGFEVIAPPSIL